MKTKRLLAGIFLFTLVTAACGGSPSSPTSSTNGSGGGTPTKVIVLGGNLSFGTVALNTTASGLLTITNSGNTALTVTGISGPCASFFSVNFTSGTIQPGATQNVAITFTPTAVQSCSGNITVASDATSGTSTISINASGSLNGIPVFTKSGVGNTVFNLPSYVTKVHITGTYSGFSSNFIVWVGPSGAPCGSGVVAGCSLLVNDLLGSAWGTSVSDGTYNTGGQPGVSIVISSNVSWTITEVRN